MVRPPGSCELNRLPSKLEFEFVGWKITERRVKPLGVVDLFNEPRKPAGLVFRDDRCLGLFSAQISPVVLSQPELNQVGQKAVLLRRIAPADGAPTNVLAQLNLERWRVAPAWTF